MFQFKELIFKNALFSINGSKAQHYSNILLKKKIPKLNDQVLISNSSRCMVYGIRQIPVESVQQEENEQKEKKEKYYDEESLLAFIVDKNSREQIEFDLAKRIATNLQLDICLMKQNDSSQNLQNGNIQSKEGELISQNGTVLSLTRFREYVYREYYLKELKNKSRKKYIQRELTNQLLMDKSQWSPSTPGSYKNRIKSVRIGQDVHSNDMKNKKTQITRWIQQGQRTIKIIANNATDKSYKAIQKFCSMFQKDVEIIEEKIQKDPKKKPIIRLYAILQFDEEIEIDFDFINKRWRRREAEIKLIQEGKNNKSSIFDIDLTQQGAQIQKAYLAAFDEAGIPYPKRYKFLSQIDEGFEKQGMMSLVRSVVEESDRNIEANINDLEDEILTEEQQKKRDKQNRQFMELRTVQDILEEMDEMKSRQYEMEQYQSSRYKELQKELTEMLKNAKKYAEKVSP